MPTASTKYPVADGQPVRLTVSIGDFQTGGSAAYLGTAKVAPDPDIDVVDLGDGSTLRGKVLVVSTTVVDIRREHDNTSATVLLTGGVPAEFPIVQAATSTPGGAVNYLTVVRFV